MNIVSHIPACVDPVKLPVTGPKRWTKAGGSPLEINVPNLALKNKHCCLFPSDNMVSVVPVKDELTKTTGYEVQLSYFDNHDNLQMSIYLAPGEAYGLATQLLKGYLDANMRTKNAWELLDSAKNIAEPLSDPPF
jgi:hypothetical protein